MCRHGALAPPLCPGPETTASRGDARLLGGRGPNLLEFDGVELILISENFISVKKNSNVEWNILKQTIISSINEYFEKNKEPILSKDYDKSYQEKEIEDDDTVVKEIKKDLDNKLR